MSKIICDICGSRYPETSAQCPICGCINTKVANIPEQPLAQPEVVEMPERTGTPGGRFSKANVNKRNQGKPVQEEFEVRAKPASKKERPQMKAQPREEFDLEEEFEDESGKKGGFINVLLVILIIALLGVCAYIFIQFFMPSLFGGSSAAVPTEPVASITEQETEAPAPTQPAHVPCEQLTTDEGTVTLQEAGQTHTLNIRALPENSTDGMIFISSNEDVATVDNGIVTAVGEGSVVITVFCGSQKLECNVICNFSAVPATEAQPEQSGSDETPAETEAPADAGVQKTVTSSKLNIRKEASSKSDLVGSYKKGDVITIYEQKKVGSQYWGRTDKGWVCMDYVK